MLRFPCNDDARLRLEMRWGWDDEDRRLMHLIKAQIETVSLDAWGSIF